MLIKYALIVSFAVLLTFQGTFASAPCAPPTKEWFVKNVIIPSDLVLFVRVSDYSNKEQRNSELIWTEFEVLDVLYGSFESNSLLIRGWQANSPPIYVYNKKASHMVVWLKRTAQGYQFTNVTWKLCVPSIWNANDEGDIYSHLYNKSIKKQGIINLISKYKP